MGYLEGFGVVVKKWFGVHTDSGRRVTAQYPEQTRPKPERFHGRHVLNRYDDGMEKCIGCELCAGVCPAKCIYVRGQDNDPDDPTSPGERFGFVYEINYLRCIHCDLCVEACPTEAITETKLFEFAFTNRADAIYTKDELLVDDDGRPRQLPWENWDGGFDAAEQSSGWMRATSPSGDADFVGIVAWAGELGYGVRPAEGTLVAEPSTDDGHDDHGHDDHAHDDHAHDDHGHDDGHDDPALPVAPPGLLDVPEPVEEPASAAASFDAVDETTAAARTDAGREAAADSDAVPAEFDLDADADDRPKGSPSAGLGGRTPAAPLLVDAVEDDERRPTTGAVEPAPTDSGDADGTLAEPSTADPEGPADEQAAEDEPVAPEPPSTAGFFDAPEHPANEAKGRRRFGRGKGDRS